MRQHGLVNGDFVESNTVVAGMLNAVLGFASGEEISFDMWVKSLGVEKRMN